MARQRSRQDRNKTSASPTPTNTTNERTRTSMATTPLDASTIQELLSKARTRGEYARELAAFLSGDENGVQVNLEEGVFAGKKPQSVKIGFENARKSKDAPEGAANVRVVMHENGVYLLRAEA